MRHLVVLLLLTALWMMPETGQAQGLIQEITFEPLPAAVQAPAPAASKRVVCATTQRAPVMDGRLDDDCWAGASRAEGFVIAGSGRAPAEATAATLLCDAQALYIGFVCHESQMPALAAPERPHDYPMWNDDVVEVLLDPTDQRTDDYHFILSAAGGQYEGHERFLPDLSGGRMDEGPGWNGAWQGVVYQGADFWSAEMAIPFATLGLSGSPGSAGWALDLMREEQPRGEISIWSGPHGGFGQMQEWGYVVLGDPEVLLGRVRVEDPGWGRNTASVVVENMGGLAKGILLEVTVRGTSAPDARQAARVTLAAGETTAVAIPFAVSGPAGEYVLGVSCMTPDRKRTYGTRSLAFKTPPLLSFSLAQQLIYVSEETLVGTVEVGAAGRSLEGLRLVATVGTPAGKTLRARPVACRGRKVELVFRVPAGPAGEYRVGVALQDAGGKRLAAREVRVERIQGPFDGTGDAHHE